MKNMENTIKSSDNDPFRKRIVNILSKCDDISDANNYFDLLIAGKSQFSDDRDMQFLQLISENLGNADRFLIIQSLSLKDRCSCEFEALLHKSQPAVSRDLKKLEQANLIKGWKKGNFIHYSLVKATFEEYLNKLKILFSQTENWFGNLP